MSDTTRTAILWAPRVLGVLTALFLALFALDVFPAARSVPDLLPGFLLHLLPSALLLGVIAVAWRRPWIGAAVFLTLATAYSVAAVGRPDWILVVAGPLALVGAPYVGSWLARAGRPGR